MHVVGKWKRHRTKTWACACMRDAHTHSPIARSLILGKEEQVDHSQIGEPPDTMAKDKERVRPHALPFLTSAFSSHPGNTSPTSQALGTLSPWFLFIYPPSPSMVPLVLYLHLGFHSFVSTTDAGASIRCPHEVPSGPK